MFCTYKNFSLSLSSSFLLGLYKWLDFCLQYIQLYISIFKSLLNVD